MKPSFTRSTTWRVLLASGAVFAAVFCLYITTATPTITTRHGGTDGGELAAVALSGGVAHPPGYPSYLLLARAALRVPWNEAAARLAVLSAVCAAGAAATTTALVAMSGGGRSRSATWPHVPAGVYAGLVLAGSARFWAQAIIVEVYALHMLWLALGALLVLRWLQTARPGLLVAAALCLGLGLGTHPTLVAAVPAAWLAWRAADPRPRAGGRVLLAALAALVLGASVYALLPLWSARDVVPSWGDQRTLHGWWAHVSSAEYRYLLNRVPVAQQLSRVGFAARDLFVQPGIVGLGLALWAGIPYGWRAHRSLLLFTGCIAACSLVFAVGYGGADGDVYLLPWTWAWCVWVGLGAASLAESIRAQRPVRWIAAIGLIASVLVPVVLMYPRMTLHADTGERDRIIALLKPLPPNAVLLSSADADTFGVWYVQRAIGVRADVLVLDTRLAQQPWYQMQVAQRLNQAEHLCQALHAAAAPTFTIRDQAVQHAPGAAWRTALGCAD